MPDLDLAVEHLRATIATAHAVEAAQTIVNVNELAALLAELDRLRIAKEVTTPWAQGAPCEDCSCCTTESCHNGPGGPIGERCPSNSLGDSICPCTGD